MTFEQFKEKVAEMRVYQKGYFATRSGKYLRKAKVLEKEVDEYLDGVEKLF